MKDNQNWLKAMMDANAARTAPQAAAPTMMNRGGVRNVTAPALGNAPQAGMTNIDPQAIELQRQAAMGLAPSQATGLLQQGIGQAGQLGMALAGARGGYSPAAVRGAQREMSAATQNAAAQASQIRAQEMASARAGFADISTRQAEITQQAKLFNTSQEGQFAMAQADMQLRAAMANQGVDLDILKANAQRGDTFALANLQAEMQTMGMNDSMQLAYVSQILGIDEQILATEMARISIDQQRYIADQQSRMGLLGSIVGAVGQAGAAVATSGASLAAPAIQGAAQGVAQGATQVPMQGAGYTPVTPQYPQLSEPSYVQPRQTGYGGASDWQQIGGRN